MKEIDESKSESTKETAAPAASASPIISPSKTSASVPNPAAPSNTFLPFQYPVQPAPTLPPIIDPSAYTTR
jgi:hypothetical protein